MRKKVRMNFGTEKTGFLYNNNIYININQIIKLISSHHSHLIPYTLRVKRHNVRYIHTHVYTYCVSLKLGEKVRTLYISTLFLTVLVKVRWEYTAAK